jgi:hypothetical protein
MKNDEEERLVLSTVRRHYVSGTAVPKLNIPLLSSLHCRTFKKFLLFGMEFLFKFLVLKYDQIQNHCLA